MKYSSTLATIILALAAISMLQAAIIYPTPQRCTLSRSATPVESVEIQLRTQGDGHDIWRQIPAEKEGAYAISVEGEKLTVRANDEVGLYYAKQTLSQMLEGVPGADNAQCDPVPGKSIEEVARMGKLPQGSVIDWPDLPFRGAVEGYYGQPWSFEARKSQFAFYGRNKMNTYIYAPKDDPYHHGEGCYLPYPADKAEEIRQLVAAAREHHVRFVWAIHPDNTVIWAENEGRAQLDGLCRKLEMMYQLGVRDFGVFVDDSFGEIGKAERQVQLANYLMEHFIRKHEDVNQTLIMCPTGYNKSWTNAKFLNTLGAGLDANIPVMWTGDTVVHDITLEGQRWVNSRVYRPTFIWWNWPCSDFKRGRLSMGRTYGLDTAADMRKEMSGFVANPMEHAEASKVGLFGVADYTWNITGFDSHTSWQNGIARLYPTCSESMQLFCNHNSYLLPNTHGYFREESTEILPQAQQLITSIGRENPDVDAARSMQEEYERIISAGTRLQQAEGIDSLKTEINAWFRAFTLTGQTGHAAMQTLLAPGPAEQTHNFFRAVDFLNQQKTLTRPEWSLEGTKAVNDVETGMLALTPALRAALAHTNARVYASLAGRPTPHPVFLTNNGNAAENAESIRDANPRTFWSSNCNQEKDFWYCLDYGKEIDIRNATLLMGGKRANDFIKEGQFEVSNDGETWTPVGAPTSGPAAVLNLEKTPVRARMIRYRVLDTRPNWVSIWEFSINKTLPPFASTNMASGRSFTAYQSGGIIGLNRVMEVFPLQPGEFIDLKMPHPVRAEWIEINLESPRISHWATVELTLDDGSKHISHVQARKSRLFLYEDDVPERPIAAIRVINSSKLAQDIKVTLFRLGMPDDSTDLEQLVLTDSDITTAFDCGKKNLTANFHIPAGTKHVIVVGSAECQIDGCDSVPLDSHLRHFTISPDMHIITLRASKQPGKFINEILFL